MKGPTTIRAQLALLITGITMAVIAAMAVFAYQQVRKTEISAAGDRLASVSHQISEMLLASAIQNRQRVAAFAGDSAIQSAIRLGKPNRERIAARLRELAGRGANPVVVLDANGALVAATDATVASTIAAENPVKADGADTTAVGPIRASGELKLAYTVGARITSGAHTEGFVVERRPVTTQGIASVQALVGSGARLLFGNANGDLWTDFSKVTPSPPAGFDSSSGVSEYIRGNAGRQLAIATPISNTPWVLVVEFPRAQVLEHATAFVWKMAAGAALFIPLVIALVWMLAGKLVRPVADLTAAAAAISDGNYGRRVDVGRQDEFGVLGNSFNQMAANITAARDALTHTVAELRGSEARYRLVFDASPHSMLVYELDTLAILAVNDAATRQYGYSRDEFLTMSIGEIGPFGEVEAPAGTDNGGHRIPAPVYLWRHQAKGGSPIDVEIDRRSVTFDGRHAQIMLIQDRTERRRAEESLRAAQDRLRRVVASSGAVMFELRLSEHDVVLDWISENVTSILGFTVEDTQASRWWSDHVHPEDRKALGTRPRYDSYRDGATEYRFRHKDGTYRWLREEQRVLRDARETPIGVIGAWIDVTARRSLEDQFRQSQKMEAVGRLAGGVAHDFNNLLTVILGESEIVLGDPRIQGSTAERSIEEIRKAATRATILTRQLLTFSRRQFIEPTTLNVNEVVDGVRTMIVRLIGEDVDLKVELCATLGATTIDRGQLEQVLVNLVVNARDAMPEGGTLIIDTQNAELGADYTLTHADVEPGQYVVLAVTDSGTGMDEETKTHLFEPFFTTKEPGKGTGLGLATSYAIVRQFRGHIGVYSEPGIGTTMRVYLPRTDDALTRPVRTSGSVVVGGNETILVVEDEVQVRRVTCRMLRARGYTVLEAGDADAALRVLEKEQTEVHLLLTDVVLPKMSGRALADQVRALWPAVRILFVSGYSDDVMLQNKLMEHQVMLLAKPFTSLALAQKVREALDQAAV